MIEKEGGWHSSTEDEKGYPTTKRANENILPTGPRVTLLVILGGGGGTFSVYLCLMDLARAVS